MKITFTVLSRVLDALMYKTHHKIWACFLVPRFIKNTVNSYSCIRRTPSFDVQFWGKKVRLIHEMVRYVCSWGKRLRGISVARQKLTSTPRRVTHNTGQLGLLLVPTKKLLPLSVRRFAVYSPCVEHPTPHLLLSFPSLYWVRVRWGVNLLQLKVSPARQMHQPVHTKSLATQIPAQLQCSCIALENTHRSWDCCTKIHTSCAHLISHTFSWAVQRTGHTPKPEDVGVWPFQVPPKLTKHSTRL